MNTGRKVKQGKGGKRAGMGVWEWLHFAEGSVMSESLPERRAFLKEGKRTCRKRVLGRGQHTQALPGGS